MAGLGEAAAKSLHEADGNDAVSVVLVDQLVHPAARGTAQLGRYREGRVAAVNDGHMAALGRNPSGQGAVGVDQVGLHRPDHLLEHFHVVLMVGAVGHAVHFHHLGARLLQGLLQQASPGDGRQGLKLALVCKAQIVENHPSRSADVGITDDVQHANHAVFPPSGRDMRREISAPTPR